MYLFFDTETNGIPKNYKAPATDLNNWPRIIQLAFILCDENFNEIEVFSQMIKPDGWVIPVEKFWIDNGYSTEKNMQDGIPMTDALQKFSEAVEKSKLMLAHNMAFDRQIITAEFLRYGMKTVNRPQPICTMKSTVSFVGAKNKNGGHKWPKLDELHNRLFGFGFDNAHDALADVRATVRCFKKLHQNELIMEWKT